MSANDGRLDVTSVTSIYSSIDDLEKSGSRHYANRFGFDKY